jgi:hypothetical protein
MTATSIGSTGISSLENCCSLSDAEKHAAAIFANVAVVPAKAGDL